MRAGCGWVRERLRGDGRVETPLDQASLDQAIAVLKREPVEAVAVCYLHAWHDPRHEKATRQAVERELPGVEPSLSAEVLPQIKEFERISTTVVNAYVGGRVDRGIWSGSSDASPRLGIAGQL